MAFTCTECGLQFTRHRYLLAHIRTTHDVGEKPTYTCAECGNTFLSKSSLKQHLIIHARKSSSPPPKFQCSQCENSYNHKRSLSRHMKADHGKDQQTLETLPSSGPQLPTSTPPSETSSSSLLPASASTSGQRQSSPSFLPSGSLKYECPYCDKSFSWRSNLCHHMKSHEQQTLETLPSSGPQHPTSTPPPESSSSSLLQASPSTSGQRHFLPAFRASESQKYECPYCGKLYIWRSNLGRHMKSSHGQKQLGPMSASGPQPPISTPSATTSFSSGQCPLSPPRMFKCAECKKPFTCRKNLVHHLNTKHFGGSLFSTRPQHHHCPDCGRKFGWPESLLRHVKKQHHPTSQLNLNIPSSSVLQPPTSTPPPESSSSSLPQPTPSTSGQCPPLQPSKHQCKYCGKLYNHRRSLSFHVQTQHASESLMPDQQIAPEDQLDVPVPAECVDTTQSTTGKQCVDLDTTSSEDSWSPAPLDALLEGMEDPFPVDYLNMTQSDPECMPENESAFSSFRPDSIFTAERQRSRSEDLNEVFELVESFTLEYPQDPHCPPPHLRRHVDENCSGYGQGLDPEASPPTHNTYNIDSDFNQTLDMLFASLPEEEDQEDEEN